MPDYTITWVGDKPREYEANGPKKAWRIALEGVEGTGELRQQAKTPAPEKGQTLAGSMEPNKSGNGWHFQKADKGGGGGFRSNGGQSEEWNPYHPRQRLIVRQSAIKAAVEHYGNLMSNTPPVDFSLEDLQKALSEWTEWFEQLTFQAVETGGGSSPVSPQGDAKSGVSTGTQSGAATGQEVQAANPGAETGQASAPPSAVPSTTANPDRPAGAQLLYDRIKQLGVPGNEVRMKLTAFNVERLSELSNRQLAEFDVWLSNWADQQVPV